MLLVGFSIMISRENCSPQDIRQEMVGGKGTKMSSDWLLPSAVFTMWYLKVLHLPHIAESCEAVFVHTSWSCYRIVANEMCVVMTSIKTRVVQPLEPSSLVPCYHWEPLHTFPLIRYQLTCFLAPTFAGRISRDSAGHFFKAFTVWRYFLKKLWSYISSALLPMNSLLIGKMILRN